MRPASRNTTGEDSGPGRFGVPSPVRRKERRKSIQEKREAVREALMAHQKQMRRDSLQRSESSAVNLLTLGSTSLEPLARSGGFGKLDISGFELTASASEAVCALAHANASPKNNRCGPEVDKKVTNMPLPDRPDPATRYGMRHRYKNVADSSSSRLKSRLQKTATKSIF